MIGESKSSSVFDIGIALFDARLIIICFLVSVLNSLKKFITILWSSKKITYTTLKHFFRVDSSEPNQPRFQVPDKRNDQAGLTEVQLKCCKVWKFHLKKDMIHSQKNCLIPISLIKTIDNSRFSVCHSNSWDQKKVIF